MNTLVIASHNKGKIAEIKQILKNHFAKIISMAEAGFTSDIAETGKTFYGNALIKAKAVSGAINLPVLADDSGLCVDVLGGAPGIYSARYAGANATDEDNKQKLLKEMAGTTSRRAYFVCSAVLYLPTGKIIAGEGRTAGEILQTYKGNNGFGYDNIFYSYELKKSFGEALEEEKNRISHRYRALASVTMQLENLKKGQ